MKGSPMAENSDLLAFAVARLWIDWAFLLLQLPFMTFLPSTPPPFSDQSPT